MQICRLCRGTGKPVGYILLNGNPCVRCGGYRTISDSCNNPKDLTQKEKEQIKLENSSYERCE